MPAALGSAVFAPESLSFVAEAKAAGIAVGILSNDLVGAMGRTWVDTEPVFREFPVIVDATELRCTAPRASLAST
jgi:hypothetical protein